MLSALSLVLVAVTISTVSTTTTMTAYAAEHSDRSDEIKDTIKAKNDDGRQAIADADCNPGDTSGVVLGDIIQAQDCDALAANRDITEQETTDGKEEPPAPETCEECFEAFLTPEEIQAYKDAVFIVGDICNFFEENSGLISRESTKEGLAGIGVDADNINDLIDCLESAGIDFAA